MKKIFTLFLRSQYCGLVIFCFLLILPLSAGSSGYVVNSTADTDDGSCDAYVEGVTDCTLREAVTLSNANAGTDTIAFLIDSSFADDGDGQWTISLASNLSLTDTVMISGASVWDVDDDRPGINVVRSGTTGNAFVFDTGSDGSSLLGLEVSGGEAVLNLKADALTIGTDCDGVTDDNERNVIYGASSKDIYLTTGAVDFLIRGNYLGVASDGLTPANTTNWAIAIKDTAGPGIIGYEEGTSGTCSATLQRNIIGAGGDSFGFGIESGQTVHDIVVTGNFIGIGKDGITSIGDSIYTGVQTSNSSTRIQIGTDGDGIDDALEENRIGNFDKGVFATNTSTNVRISGNIIGIDTNGDEATVNSGIIVRNVGTIVGWCDTSVNATMCNDGGSQSTQANTVGYSTSRHLRFDNGADDAYIYGNYFGTDATGVVDYGSPGDGIEMRQTNKNGPFLIGGNDANRQNIIKFNNVGITINGQSKGASFLPLADYQIVGNTISENDTYGIHVLTTELHGSSAGPTDGTITDNTIATNGSDGILVEGSSPEIDNNTVTSNSGYGLHVISALRPSLESYTNPFGTLSPQEVAEDAVAEPTITNNTISTNTLGGIYILDALPSNASTLADDNTVTSNLTFNIQQDFYTAVELLMNGAGLSEGSLSVVFRPSNQLTCTNTCTGSSVASADTSYIWGPSGIDYDDATTWFTLTDYRVDTNDVRQDYNPYALEILGSYRNGTSTPQPTIDGDISDDTSTALLSASLSSGTGIARYQIPEAVVIPRTSSIDLDQPTTVTVTPGTVIPHLPVGISGEGVRWYFSPEGNDAETFHIVTSGTEEHPWIIVGEGKTLSPNGWMFIEELGLQPLRRYCDRSVIAVGKEGLASEPVPLPCGTTRAKNDTLALPTADQSFLFASGEAVLTKSITPSPLSHSTTTSLIALGASAFLLSGLREQKNRSRHPTTSLKTRTTFRVFCVTGVILAGSLWGMSFVILSCPESACATTPPTIITDQTPLHAGDRVELRYTVVNLGGQTDSMAVFSLPKKEGLTIKEKDIRVNKHQSRITEEEEALSIALGDIASGSEFTIIVQATIESTSSFTFLARLNSDSSPKAEVTPIGFPVVDLEGNVKPIQTISGSFQPAPYTALRGANISTVYMVNASLQLRPFINEATFFTWFNFGEVRVVPDSDILSLPTAPAMTVRPGTVPVKLTTEPFVYAVEPNQILRYITSENEARRLYGDDWAKKIIHLSLDEYQQYHHGEALPKGDYPDGMLITDGRMTCYMEWRHCRPITGDGFRNNGLHATFVTSISEGGLDELPRARVLNEQEDRASSY